MEALKQSVADLFFPDDEISCSGIPAAYCVTGIDPERIQLRALTDEAEEISFGYAELSTTLTAMDSSDSVQVATPLQCFASQLLLRQEQAARDEEVDAMWRTAMVCQL